MNIDPFGYFRPLPFGWEDCADTDEGATPLYDQCTIDGLQGKIQQLQSALETESVLLRECRARGQAAQQTDNSGGTTKMAASTTNL